MNFINHICHYKCKLWCKVISLCLLQSQMTNTHVDCVLYSSYMMVLYETCTCTVAGLLREYSQLITFVSSLVYKFCHIHYDFDGGNMYFNILPLWDVTQFRLVGSYVCFGTTCWSHLQGDNQFGLLDSLKMGLGSCPETLVTNYQSMLHNIPEEGR
jgi:hypothetical protein